MYEHLIIYLFNDLRMYILKYLFLHIFICVLLPCFVDLSLICRTYLYINIIIYLR